MRTRPVQRKASITQTTHSQVKVQQLKKWCRNDVEMMGLKNKKIKNKNVYKKQDKYEKE